MFSITILRNMQDLGGTTINPILHHTTVNNNINNLTQIKDSCRSSRRRNNKLTSKPHARRKVLILRAILQLMEQMTRMNSRLEEIQDFIKRKVQPMADKKGKKVSFFDQLPLQATTNTRNQGSSLSQTHNLNHVHVDEEVVETTLAISSLRSVTRRDREVVDFTWYRVKNYSKLTNFENL